MVFEKKTWESPRRGSGPDRLAMDAAEGVNEYGDGIPIGEVGSSIPGSDATNRTKAISARDRKTAGFCVA